MLTIREAKQIEEFFEYIECGGEAQFAGIAAVLAAVNVSPRAGKKRTRIVKFLETIKRFREESKIIFDLMLGRNNKFFVVILLSLEGIKNALEIRTMLNKLYGASLSRDDALHLFQILLLNEVIRKEKMQTIKLKNAKFQVNAYKRTEKGTRALEMLERAYSAAK